MGVEISHGAFCDGYKHFNKWRNCLAVTAGYALETVTVPFGCMDLPVIDWANITDTNVHGHWDVKPNDALFFLICHTEDSGVIELDDLVPLIARLEAVVETMVDPDDIIITRNFINGCREAIALREPLQFS